MKLRFLRLLSGVALISGGSALAHEAGTCHEGETPKACLARLRGSSARELSPGKDVRTANEETAAPSSTRAEEKKFDRAADKAANTASDVAFEVTHPKVAERRGQLGVVNRGTVDNTVTTDPLAIISGSGINAQYARSLLPKFSGVAGASFARVRAGGGSLNNFGGTLGLDYFAIGRDNEGLRIGPRFNFGVGRDTIGTGNTFGNVGAAGEAGYNYIANNGITAGLAGGLGFSTGTEPDDTNIGTQRIDVRADPYAKLNLGYSW